MSDTHYSPATQKKLIILFRAEVYYPNDSVQSTVRFLVPRVPEDGIPRDMPTEWTEARRWWEKKSPEDQERLNATYKFAAKIH